MSLGDIAEERGVSVVELLIERLEADTIPNATKWDEFGEYVNALTPEQYERYKKGLVDYTRRILLWLDR